MAEKKINQRVMLSKRLIKESLTELLKTKGIHNLSVRLLCETAGINRTTFYKYYGSQYDVLAEMEEELLEAINRSGIGPGGLGGTTTALGVNIQTYPTHIAGLPVAVNICCHVNRHSVRTI